MSPDRETRPFTGLCLAALGWRGQPPCGDKTALIVDPGEPAHQASSAATSPRCSRESTVLVCTLCLAGRSCLSSQLGPLAQPRGVGRWLATIAAGDMVAIERETWEGALWGSFGGAANGERPFSEMRASAKTGLFVWITKHFVPKSADATKRT